MYKKIILILIFYSFPLTSRALPLINIMGDPSIEFSHEFIKRLNTWLVKKHFKKLRQNSDFNKTMETYFNEKTPFFLNNKNTHAPLTSYQLRYVHSLKQKNLEIMILPKESSGSVWNDSGKMVASLFHFKDKGPLPKTCSALTGNSHLPKQNFSYYRFNIKSEECAGYKAIPYSKNTQFLSKEGGFHAYGGILVFPNNTENPLVEMRVKQIDPRPLSNLPTHFLYDLNTSWRLIISRILIKGPEEYTLYFL